MKFAVNAKSKALLLLFSMLAVTSSAAEPDYDNDIEKKFDYANSFLAGFRSAETIPSATVCT